MLLLPTLLIAWLVAFESPVPATKLHFVHRFGSKTFQLNAPYQTLNSDQVTFTRFKYYVSNVTLYRKDGTTWQQPESYHLIDVSEEAESLPEILLNSLPSSEYTHLSFAIGVDSIRNHSGEQIGALNPDNGMFWMWESGYVFLKSEGYVHNQPGKRGAMVHHIGRDECYQVIKLPLQQKKIADSNQINVAVDVQKLFGGFRGAAVRVKAPADHSPMRMMGGKDARLIAKNYAQMFSIQR